MHILLIAPTFHYAIGYPAFLSFSDFPSGIAYIASSLKQAGHKVFGCNPNNIPGYANVWLMLQDVLSSRIKEVQPELIGLGGLCTDYRFLKDAISVIRETNPEIPIVLGGQIVTNDAEDVFQLLKPDYAVKGEGENAIIEIIKGTLRPGIVSVPPPILDNQPFPDYEPFGIQEMLDEYSPATRLLYRYSRPDARPFNIVASRGCPFACTFCIDHHRSYRTRSIENIMAEIKEMYERYGFNVLIVLDELFAINKQRMIDFCAGITEGKKLYGWDFDWMFQTHANARFDLETLKLAKEAGCYFFSYGLESASPEVLKSMNKNLKLDQVIEAIKLAEEAKLGFGANLIFGDIAETEQTAAESLAFWFKYCRRSFVFLAELKPYPGSKLFEVCRENGMFPNKQEFYETIDQVRVNMTSMTDETYGRLMELISHLERSWLFVETAGSARFEVEKTDGLLRTYRGGEYYKVESSCPYCGEALVYREIERQVPFILGTGCWKCNRKIKVEVR